MERRTGEKSIIGRGEIKDEQTPAELIQAKFEALGDWRGKMLSRIRSLVREADPDVLEELKWKKPSNPAGVPTWSHAGIICIGDAFKGKVKITFAKGAALQDPSGLFNASLEGNAMRAIDIREGEAIDEEAFKALFRDAVELNTSIRTGGSPQVRTGGKSRK